MKRKDQTTLIRRTRENVEELTAANIIPEMYDAYVAGQTYAQIAQTYNVVSMFHLAGRCKDPEDVATSIVGHALRAYAPNTQEREAISSRRSLGNLVSGRGHFQDLDTSAIRSISNAGVIARGRTPLTDADKARIIELSENPAYQTSRGVNAKKIGEEVGRTSGAIRSVIYKLKNTSIQD